MRAGSAIRAPGTPATNGGERAEWPLPGGDEYELADVFLLSAQRVAEIRAAAARAWAAVRAVAPIARALPDDVLAEFGIPATARAIVRTVDDAAPETLIGRFDFIETADGYRVIELNAETPFFIIESHRASGIAARMQGYDDPNAGCAGQLGRTIATAIGARSTRTRVTIAAHDGSAEDRATARYLQSIIAAASPARVDYAPLSTLRVRADGLYGPAGRIDLLYRLYPLEQLAADRVAPRLFDLIADGALRVLNPPSALVAQSKMLFVLIWGLAARPDILSPELCAAIRQTYLPTFADLPLDGKSYVRKRVLGREGTSVAIIAPDGSIRESAERRYDAQPCVYQEFRPLPRWWPRTPSGRRIDGHVLTTCFIVGGQPGAVGIRVGGEITDGRAHFAPVGTHRNAADSSSEA